MKIATIPPPVDYLVCAVLGLVADQWVAAFTFATWVRASGVVVIVASFAIMPFVLSRFRAADTPFDVRKQPTGLVTSGPFRYSRNPSYVALTLLYLGVALVIESVGMLVLSAIPVLVLDRWVIPLEEARLGEQFGDAYATYRQRVRRWL